jgi:hypothetical protein
LAVSITEGADFNAALTAAVTDFGKLLNATSQKESTLADGTKSYTAVIKYTPTVNPAVEADAFALGAQKDNKWVIITVSTVKSFAPYNEAQFSEIANTLTFKK